MGPDELLAAFDAQVRRHPRPAGPGETIERTDLVVRTVGTGDGWNGVNATDLDEQTADAAIGAEIERFARQGGQWEWKHYSYDRPADLAQRLLAAGFVPEPAESLLVADLRDGRVDATAPAGVELRPVVDAAGAGDLVSVHDEVFGGDHAPIGRMLLEAIAREDDLVSGVVAYSGGVPISAARIEFQGGTEFASIWGGGTLPAWRHRGVFRSLVGYRAGLAAARGYRYLQVDASDDSRPILERLGFVFLATTTPYIHPGA